MLKVILPILDFAAGIGFGIYDRIKQNEADNYNKIMQENDRNYSRQLQQTMFEREDNAMQRKMADYERAGLSRFAAVENSTGGGTGQEISRSIPQMPREFAKLQLQSGILDNLLKQKQIEQLDAGIDSTRAQTENLLKKQPYAIQILQNTAKNLERDFEIKGGVLQAQKIDLINKTLDALENLVTVSGDSEATGIANTISHSLQKATSIEELKIIEKMIYATLGIDNNNSGIIIEETTHTAPNTSYEYEGKYFPTKNDIEYNANTYTLWNMLNAIRYGDDWDWETQSLKKSGKY